MRKYKGKIISEVTVFNEAREYIESNKDDSSITAFIDSSKTIKYIDKYNINHCVKILLKQFFSNESLNEEAVLLYLELEYL